jgi:ubiquinone/menaquinone biosynthesis C-methylase UbiE
VAKLKLNLGAGDTKLDGFISVDKYDKAADVQADITELPYENNSVDEIVAYQVIEHVPYNLNQKMFEEFYRVLKEGGTCILETPDVDVICKFILRDGLTDQWRHNLVGEYHRPWDKDRYDDWEHHAGSIHRNPWNFALIQQYAKGAGFKVVARRDPDFYPVEENMSVGLVK